MMADFAESAESDDVREGLLRAIQGRGAFRYFKDRIHELGIADDWYAFRKGRYEEIAKEWCQDNGIEVEP